MSVKSSSLVVSTFLLIFFSCEKAEVRRAEWSLSVESNCEANYARDSQKEGFVFTGDHKKLWIMNCELPMKFAFSDFLAALTGEKDFDFRDPKDVEAHAEESCDLIGDRIYAEKEQIDEKADSQRFFPHAEFYHLEGNCIHFYKSAIEYFLQNEEYY